MFQLPVKDAIGLPIVSFESYLAMDIAPKRRRGEDIARSPITEALLESTAKLPGVAISGHGAVTPPADPHHGVGIAPLSLGECGKKIT
jgi:hypothetical protein